MIRDLEQNICLLVDQFATVSKKTCPKPKPIINVSLKIDNFNLKTFLLKFLCLLSNSFPGGPRFTLVRPGVDPRGGPRWDWKILSGISAGIGQLENRN